MSGKKVKEYTTDVSRIQVDDLSSGLYLLNCIKAISIRSVELLLNKDCNFFIALSASKSTE